MLIDLFLKVHPTPKLNDAECEALEAASTRTARFGAQETIAHENVRIDQCNLLIEGIVQRYKDVGDGTRQILAFHVPGDFIDLHSYPLKRLEHTMAALTPVKVALFPHPAIRALTERSATLTELLWRSTLIDAAMNREWLVSIGTRSAIARLAHLFCEMFVRFGRIGMVKDDSFAFPVRQTDLADATGLTSVHANRMLKKLREQGLVDFRAGVVTIKDWDGLRSIGDFDADYLFLE